MFNFTVVIHAPGEIHEWINLDCVFAAIRKPRFFLATRRGSFIKQAGEGGM